MKIIAAFAVGLVLAGAAIVFAASPGFYAAEIAASIQYDFVQPPAGLSADFEPRGDFVAVSRDQGHRRISRGRRSLASESQTAGGHDARGDGARQWRTATNVRRKVPSVPRLAAKGYAVLAISTRQHDAAINTENFFDVRRDIEAAVQTGRALGYKTLVLQGHSLGNIQVQFYAATNWDRDIKAVMLLGPFGNLPWKTRSILVQNEDSFRGLIDAAMKSLRDGTLDKVLPVKMHYFTGQDVPVTGQHFLTYRWSETSVADGTFWIHRIPMPILLVRDQSDAIIQPFEPYQLLAAAHGEGSLAPSVDYVLLPDANPMSPKGTLFRWQ